MTEIDIVHPIEIPSPVQMKELIVNLAEPTVIRNGVKDWELLKWNLNDWSNTMHGTKLPFRVGKRLCSTIPQWERTCGSLEMTLDEFIKRVENDEWKDEWAYFDYKYMHQWFKDHKEILQSISWKDFGFPDVNGEESTMWLGTTGAHTPCHLDSYSLNIVAQIYGRKMWVMFPPKSTNKLRPTRVPYEESSVYSKINFYCGYSDYSLLDDAYFIVLEPGDVLVVPNQWWHYVENLSTAISINTWIPLDNDDNKRLEESIVRSFISSSIKDLPLEVQKQILNPNEEILLEANGIDVNQLNLCVENCKNEAPTKVEIRNTSLKNEDKQFDVNVYKNIQTVNKVPFDEVVQFLRSKCNCKNLHLTKSGHSKSDLTIEDYINAFCHPNIIKLVKSKLISNKK